MHMHAVNNTVHVHNQGYCVSLVHKNMHTHSYTLYFSCLISMHTNSLEANIVVLKAAFEEQAPVLSIDRLLLHLFTLLSISFLPRLVSLSSLRHRHSCSLAHPGWWLRRYSGRLLIRTSNLIDRLATCMAPSIISVWVRSSSHLSQGKTVHPHKWCSITSECFYV